MLRTIFVILILVPGLVAALRSRFVALLLYLWYALFRPQEWLWWDMSALRVSLLLGVLVVVPCLATGVYPYFAHPISIAGVLFFAASALAQLNAVDPVTSFTWLEQLFRLLLVCLLGVSLISNQRRFKLTLIVIAASFGFHAAKAGLMSLLGGGVRLSDGLAGAYADNNGYAVAIAMIMPLLVAAGQNVNQRWAKYAFYIAVPCSVLTVVSTYSRGGFLSVAAGAAAFAALQRQRFAAFALAGLLALPVGVFMTMQEGYFDRLGTIRSYEETNETSALGRLHFWRVALDMAVDRPLGVGLFGYEPAYDRYDFLLGQFGHRRSVHSSHIQTLAETGFPGAAAWVVAWIVAFRAAFRIRRRGSSEHLSRDDQILFVTGANGLIASMSAFLVGGSFVSMALNDLTWFTFALVTSLDLISRRACEVADHQRVETETEAVTPAAFIPVTWRPVKERAR
jgi:putative inorganic carbon (HCO3(-)) transporter